MPRSVIALFRSGVSLAMMLAVAAAMTWGLGVDAAEARVRNGLLYEETFDDGKYAPLRIDDNSNTTIGIRRTSPAPRAGTGACDFVLNYNAPIRGRTELSAEPAVYFKQGSEYWIGMSFYIPDNWGSDISKEIVTQFYARNDTQLGEAPRNPPVALYVDGNSWSIHVRADTKQVTRTSYSLDRTYNRLVPLARGQWTDWVFHLRNRYDSQGLLEAWCNGKKVLVHMGGVTYNDIYGGYLKFGIYKWDWMSGPTQVSSRHLVIDEVRVGSASATYADVAPGDKAVVNASVLPLLLLGAR